MEVARRVLATGVMDVAEFSLLRDGMVTRLSLRLSGFWKAGVWLGPACSRDHPLAGQG